MLIDTAASVLRNEVKVATSYPAGTSSVIKLVPGFMTRTCSSSRTTGARQSGVTRDASTESTIEEECIVEMMEGTEARRDPKQRHRGVRNNNSWWGFEGWKGSDVEAAPHQHIGKFRVRKIPKQPRKLRCVFSELYTKWCHTCARATSSRWNLCSCPLAK